MIKYISTVLKFEFDQEKENVFTSFWQINNVSQFKDIHTNQDLFFIRFCYLNEIGLSVIGKLINFKIQSGEIIHQDQQLKWNEEETEKPSPPKDGRFQTTDTEIDYQEIFELLDSLHIINLWRNKNVASSNPLLSPWDFTEEFKKFLTNVTLKPFSTNQPQQKIDKQTLSKLNNEEKKILKKFTYSYAFTNNEILSLAPQEDIILLKKKGLIDFFLRPNLGLWTPVIIAHPQLIHFVFKNEDQEKNFIYPLENLCQSIFFIDMLKFEASSSLVLQKYHPKNETKKKFLIKLFNYLNRTSKKFSFYQNQNFYKKILFILKHHSPSYYLLKIIFQNNPQNNLQNNLINQSTQDPIETSSLEASTKYEDFFGSFEKLLYLINKKCYTLNQEKITIESLKKSLRFLQLLGLVVKKNDFYYFEKHTLHELSKIIFIKKDPDKINENLHEQTLESPKEKSIPDILVIDSDHSIIANKDKIDPASLYFLYLFCNLKISTHLIRAYCSNEKSSLAWFYSLTSEKIIHFFKEKASLTLQEDFEEFLSLYFEYSPFFKLKTTVKLVTLSKNFFYRLKYFLDKDEYLNQITVLEDKRTFIFHNQEIYQKVKEQLINNSVIKIFSENK